MKENTTTIYRVLRGRFRHIVLGTPHVWSVDGFYENMIRVKSAWYHIELVGRLLEDAMCQHVAIPHVRVMSPGRWRSPNLLLPWDALRCCHVTLIRYFHKSLNDHYFNIRALFSTFFISPKSTRHDLQLSFRSQQLILTLTKIHIYTSLEC